MRHHNDNRSGARHARQRGALIFITPMVMFLIILLSVMALDGARIYSVRQDMQSQINAAATAAADAAQACGGQDISLDTIKARAFTAAQAQGFQGSESDLQVEAGVLEGPDKDGELAFRSTPFLDQSNAVRVSYKRNERISMLLPQSALGGVDLSVNAAARKEVIATLSGAGSTAIVDGGLLGGLLGAVLGGGSSYSLDPTSLSSLQDTTVKLGQLLDTLGVNNVAALLPLTGDDLAGGLRDIAGATTPVGQLLDNLAGAAGVQTVKVSDILSVVGDAQVPRGSEFPLYDVVVSLVLNIAKQQQPGEDGILDLPLNINNLSIPLVADIDDVSLGLHVGEAPTLVLGPARRGADGEWETRFYAPDITLQLRVDASVAPLNLLGLVKFSLAKLTIPLAVDVGGGEGELVSALCARGTHNSVEFGVHLNRSVASIVTGSIDEASGEVAPQPLETDVGSVSLLLGLISVDPILHLAATVDGSVPGVEKTVILDPRYPLYCDAETGCSQVGYQDSGSGVAGLNLSVNIDDASLLQTSLGGISITSILAPVTNLVSDLLNTVVSSVAQSIVDPLLKLLGLGLGGISVTVSGADQHSTIQLIQNVPTINGN